MKKIIIYIIAFFALFYVQTYGQNTEFIRADFKGREKELRKALKEIKAGDEAISKSRKNYQSALDNYLQADTINNNSSLLNYKIGVCLLNTTMQKFKAVSYLEKSFKLNPNVKEDILYQLGQAYQLNYEFDKAINKYEGYKKLLKASYYDKIIDKKIDECNTAKELVKHPVDVIIENAGENVNSKYPDYSPIINAKETMMIFTSKKENTTGGKISPYDNKYYEDIYLTYFNDNESSWSKPFNPGSPINTKFHDATVGLSPDGKKLLIYKTKHNGDIYESIMDSLGKLSKPKRLPAPINSPAHESVASFSPDGKTLYFCSNREETSFGQHDIFLSKQNAKGQWGPAINMGNVINTQYDERSVFMMGDGKTLYFSSNGHNTMGGYDIFKTVYENGHWSTPVNIGYPINTPDDELNFSISANGQHGYFASARPGGYGDLDIYRVTFLNADKPLRNTFEKIIASTFNPEGNFNVIEDKDESGHIFDASTFTPVKAIIYVKDKETDKYKDTLTSDAISGSFKSKLKKGKAYEVKVIAKNYEPYSENIPKDKSINKTIYLFKKSTLLPSVSDGYVYDIDSREPVCRAEITIMDTQIKEKNESLISDCSSGKFHSGLPQGRSYSVTAVAKDYKPYTELVSADKDLNKLILMESINPKIISLKGNIYDAVTKQPLSSAVIIRNETTDQLVDSITTDSRNGSYKSTLAIKRYYLTVRSEGYIPYFETIKVSADETRDIYLNKGNAEKRGEIYDITRTKSFVLPNILYDYNKYDLKPQSKDSLKALVNTMRAFPNIVIELSSHTDTRGTEEYNEKLSYNRAKSVVDYLISLGISSNRLIAKGYGKKVPRKINKDIKYISCNKTYIFPKGSLITDEYINALKGGQCEAEAAHQLNRRTEFKIISDKFNPDSAKKQNNSVDIEVIK